jgi:hypothetical protein
MSTPSPDRLRSVVELACRAPSVHNTQPWRWRIVGDTGLALYADRDRQLPVADPDGRDLALSCGAALHHAIVSAGAMGMTPTVDLLPDPVDTDLLARLHLSPGRPLPDAQPTLQAVERRCTDRRRFTSWPVPDSRLTHLAEAGSGWGAHAIPITDVTARFRTELLVHRAMTSQESDLRFAEEQAEWTDHSTADGIPVATATPPPGARPAQRPNRFAGRPDIDEGQRLVESSDGLIAICTAHDDQHSWLQAGQALSALWLRATTDGLSIVPLSQLIEVRETRDALHNDVFAGMARPQLLVRVGWQEIARSSLPRTPRRALDDVLA